MIHHHPPQLFGNFTPRRRVFLLCPAELGDVPELLVELLEAAGLLVAERLVGVAQLPDGPEHDREHVVALGEERRDELRHGGFVERALEPGADDRFTRSTSGVRASRT